MKNEKQEPILICCGILKDEIQYILKKENIPLQCYFLNSSLHVYFGKLEKAVLGMFEKYHGSGKILIYGTCHPLMDRWCRKYNVNRIKAQNCIEMLLGNSLFTEELSQGAFFLMEDWARRFEEIMACALDKDFENVKKVIKEQHKYLVGLTTPCSKDFKNKAQELSQKMEMELKWIHSDLSYLKNQLMVLTGRKEEL